MTIYDIAKLAGVSTATVSRVLNGGKSVSEETRQAVMHVIRQNGYQPSAIARGLSLKTMNMIGILAADCQSVFLSMAIHHLENFLRDKSYGTLLCCTGYDYQQKKNRVSFLLSKNVDAIILVGSGYVYKEDVMNDYIREAANKVPVILINAFLQHPNIYSIACDDRRAVSEAAEWLYRTGSENVLFFYNQETYSGICKLAGFHETARRHDKDWQNSSLKIPNEVQNVSAIVDFLSARYPDAFPFDAIITADDNLAVGALKFAKLRGLKVPEQLRVIGFNNSSIAQICEPELTSIDNRLEEMCRLCVDMLEKVLESGENVHNRILSAKLVHRGTA